MVRKAYSAVMTDAMPPEYHAQQQQLRGLMSLMNAEFGRLLKFYALTQGSDALSPYEEVEKASMTQLTFEGFTLELTTVDLSGQSLSRKVWTTSIIFDLPCDSAEMVEQKLIDMFSDDNTYVNQALGPRQVVEQLDSGARGIGGHGGNVKL